VCFIGDSKKNNALMIIPASAITRRKAAIPHGTLLSVASPGLASYHQGFRYGDTCIGKEDSRFTVRRITGQLVTGEYQLVENDIAYYNECPSGTFVMTAEDAEKLCRAQAHADEREWNKPYIS
jgi:hypothetical protein